jgi:hypothetical protein
MNSAVVTSPPHNPLTNDLSAIAPANAQFLAQPRKLLIDGVWVPAVSGKTFEVRDPSSDAVIAHCALGEAADIDRAVAAARHAFEDAARGVAHRRGYLLPNGGSRALGDDDYDVSRTSRIQS